MNKGNMELGYWNIKGRAEPIRLLIKFLGIPSVNFFNYESPESWFERKKN